MEGLESGMRDVMAALSGLGSKMERLAELSLATQKAGLATAASVEVLMYDRCASFPRRFRRGCPHRHRFRCYLLLAFACLAIQSLRPPFRVYWCKVM